MTANESAQRGVRKGTRKGRQREIHNDARLHLLYQFPGRDRGLGMTSSDEFHPYQARPAQQEDPAISSDNGHLFSNLRRHEEISESSGTRHCQSGWVTAIWPPSKAWAASLGDRNRDRNQHLGDLL